MAPISEPPVQLKAIQSFIKISNDIEKRDPIVSYWIRLYSTETALKIDKDSPECKKFLCDILIWLENFKQSHKDEERVTNQTVGQAHFENYVMNIFNMADTLDRNGDATRKTVAMFFMATMLFEAMSVFGPLSEELQQRAKYAKFKAAYIQKCIKTGQTPKPGPIDNTDLDSEQSSEVDNKPNPDSFANSRQDPFILNPSSDPPLSNNTRLSSDGSNTAPLVLPETPDRDKVGNAANTSNTSIGSSGPPVSNYSKPTITATKFHAINGAPLKVDDIVMSQKYCKFATSALQYDDINTAVSNLEKALKLLKTGEQTN